MFQCVIVYKDTKAIRLYLADRLQLQLKDLYRKISAIPRLVALMLNAPTEFVLVCLNITEILIIVVGRNAF